MFVVISSVISFGSVLSKVIALKTFIEYKNLVLGTLGLPVSSHITIDNAQTIWIYKQAFIF